MPNPTNSISVKEAKKNIDNEIPLRDSSATEILEIEGGSDWNIMVQFYKRVTIKNSYVKNASFNFSYFIGGLTIDNCVFDEYLDFEAGGHNSPGNFVIIKDNCFRSFVNFFDCWFTGEISIDNNTFENGTNILSKNQLVSFDVPILTQNNVGDLSIESECKAS